MPQQKAADGFPVGGIEVKESHGECFVSKASSASEGKWSTLSVILFVLESRGQDKDEGSGCPPKVAFHDEIAGETKWAAPDADGAAPDQWGGYILPISRNTSKYTR
jgi:hypothetical protein